MPALPTYRPVLYCAMTSAAVGLPLAQPRTITRGLATFVMYLLIRAASSGVAMLPPISCYISVGMPAALSDASSADASCAS